LQGVQGWDKAAHFLQCMAAALQGQTQQTQLLPCLEYSLSRLTDCTRLRDKLGRCRALVLADGMLQGLQKADAPVDADLLQALTHAALDRLDDSDAAVRRAAVRLLPRLLNVDDQVWRVLTLSYAKRQASASKPQHTHLCSLQSLFSLIPCRVCRASLMRTTPSGQPWWSFWTRSLVRHVWA
jgi:hypothetical protein